MTNDYAIRLTRLSYTYHDGSKALDGIDLDVRRSERVALVGPSGAGKSTLLLHLNGVLPSNGSVRVLGRAVSEGELHHIRREVGLVFQDPNDQLFCPTVYEDLAFGPMNLSVPPGEIPGRVERALRDVGLEYGIRNRSSHHLSFGERKRVALATVLVMEPAVLALDEPTSNLDPRNRRHLIEVMSSLSATLVVASHDLELVAALCPRTVVLDRGQIWADGETSRILSDSQLMHDHGLEVPLSLRYRHNAGTNPAG
jgi:cobalt/nickel transport system ATP-binding protein